MFLNWALGVAFGYLVCDMINDVKKKVANQSLFDAMQKQQLDFINAKSTNDEFERKLKRR